MERDSLSSNNFPENTNWNSPLADNQQQQQQPSLLSNLLLENISTADSPYSTGSVDQDDKASVMGALFQLHHHQKQYQLEQQHISDKQQEQVHEQQRNQLQLLQQQQKQLNQHEQQKQQQQLQQLQQHQTHQMDQAICNDMPPKDENAFQDTNAEQRYQTTVSALEATGLLDITLKTSELAQRNEAFQKDLDMFEKVVGATFEAIRGHK